MLFAFTRWIVGKLFRALDGSGGNEAERGQVAVMKSRSAMIKRALGGENAWLIPTSRAKLLRKAVSPKSPGQKRVEGVLQDVASGVGKAKSLGKFAAGGTIAYLISKAIGGAGSVVFEASKRRVQSLSGSNGSSRSGSSTGSTRSSSAKSSSGRNSSSRSTGSRSNNRKTTSRKKTTARKSSNGRKKPTSRKKSTGRKKTTARAS